MIYTALFIVLLLCTASSGAPLPPEAQHRRDFAQGIFITTLYYTSRPNELANPHVSITNAQFGVLSKTCQLLSLTQKMSSVQDFDLIFPLLNTTLTHGCYHIRDMLGELVVPTATASAPTTTTTSSSSGTVATQEQASDSCSQLQYLNTVCASAPELINVVTRQTAQEILVEYIGDEGFNLCKWVRDNNLPQNVVSTLFSAC